MRYESSFSFDIALLVPYVVIISPLWITGTGLVVSGWNIRLDDIRLFQECMRADLLDVAHSGV